MILSLSVVKDMELKSTSAKENPDMRTVKMSCRLSLSVSTAILNSEFGIVFKSAYAPLGLTVFSMALVFPFSARDTHSQ